MKLKRYKKKNIGTYVGREIAITIVSIIAALVVINYFYHQFNQVILPMAEAKTRQYITMIINESTNNINFNKDLFSTQINNKNEITMINYNTNIATKLINDITDNIQDRLYYQDSNFTISEIPFGVVFNNGILKNLGPRIKVRIESIGDIISELETEVKPYGINNALVEVRVKIMTNTKIVLPLVSKEIKINNVIPISINIINGSIPEAYIASYK